MKFILACLLAFSASSAIAKPTNTTSYGPKDMCYIQDYKHLDWALKNCMQVYIDGLNVPKLCKPLLLELKDGAKLRFKNRIVFGYCEFDGPLVIIKGNNLYVDAEPGSALDGQGALYWDGLGDNGRRKPFFVRVQTTNSHVKDITVLNCPKQCVTIYGSHNTVVSGWNVDVSKGDVGVAPVGKEGRNTDGFGIVSSTYITLEQINVHNQDDCVVINTGMHLTIRNIRCYGRTHGLSIAVGQSAHFASANNFGWPVVPDSHVENVTFQDSTLTSAMNGMHIKTVPGPSRGVIKDVVYRNIGIKDVDYHGIIIRQDYDSWGHPEANILIQNLVIDNFFGTVKGRDASAVTIYCAKGGCNNFRWKDIKISHTGGNRQPNSCNYRPQGFNC